MMSAVDSMSSIAMDTPIATIFVFKLDWTADVIVSGADLVIVLRDVEEELMLVAKSDKKIMVGSSPIKFSLAMQHTIYVTDSTYVHMTLYAFL
jgi:hypothetical protein